MTPCWIWVRAIQRTGYGNLTIDGKNMLAHRYAWEQRYGYPVPTGMQLHHLCANKRCYNPDHLQVVSQRAHLLIENRSCERTHCSHGHALENNFFITDGRRKCRICHRETTRKANQRFWARWKAPRRPR